MRFMLDHDVPERVAQVLTQAGNECVRLRHVLPGNSPDESVLRYAIKESLVLVTCNRDDFVALGHRLSHPGIIILIRRKNRLLGCAALLRLLDRAGVSGLDGNINFA